MKSIFILMFVALFNFNFNLNSNSFSNEANIPLSKVNLNLKFPNSFEFVYKDQIWESNCKFIKRRLVCYGNTSPVTIPKYNEFANVPLSKIEFPNSAVTVNARRMNHFVQVRKFDLQYKCIRIANKLVCE